MSEVNTTQSRGRSSRGCTNPAWQIAQLIAQDDFCMQCLEAVTTLELPDWAIGAGFVRNVVWDRLHEFRHRTPLPDIDVLYFDMVRRTAAEDSELERMLTDLCPGRPWSVRNQARMHRRNGDQPYHSTEDAMRYWLEKPTAVAVRINRDAEIEILAPFGVECLIEMRGEPTPSGLRKYDQYTARMQAKNWPAIWPKVRVEGLPPALAG